jgi:ribonuclease VapC
MVIDTSALLAILLREPLADQLVAAIEADPVRLVSAASVVETGLVLLGRFGENAEPQLDRLLRSVQAEVAPVTEAQATLAREAALRFGRGRHPAGLNYGDCFTYALAADRGEPVLCVGGDFPRTDLGLVSLPAPG